jgi:hypothetical protein
MIFLLKGKGAGDPRPAFRRRAAAARLDVGCWGVG